MARGPSSILQADHAALELQDRPCPALQMGLRASMGWELRLRTAVTHCTVFLSVFFWTVHLLSIFIRDTDSLHSPLHPLAVFILRYFEFFLIQYWINLISHIPGQLITTAHYLATHYHCYCSIPCELCKYQNYMHMVWNVMVMLSSRHFRGFPSQGLSHCCSSYMNLCHSTDWQELMIRKIVFGVLTVVDVWQESSNIAKDQQFHS